MSGQSVKERFQDVFVKALIISFKKFQNNDLCNFFLLPISTSHVI